MNSPFLIDPYLTKPDLLVLKNLLGDIKSDQCLVSDNNLRAPGQNGDASHKGSHTANGSTSHQNGKISFLL
jgi:hypothetical protein